jgi:hypothetical protein
MAAISQREPLGVPGSALAKSLLYALGPTIATVATTDKLLSRAVGAVVGPECCIAPTMPERSR